MGQPLPTIQYMGNVIPLEEVPLLDVEFDPYDDPDAVSTNSLLGEWKNFLNHYAGGRL